MAIAAARIGVRSGSGPEQRPTEGIMNTSLKAIETVYHGYRFRSRLEARWAVFLDTLQIKYAYEAQGYDLDGKRYLPDFAIEAPPCFIEIKGQEPSRSEEHLCFSLAETSERTVYLLAGSPWPGEYEIWRWRPEWGVVLGGERGLQWASCSPCGKMDTVDPRTARTDKGRCDAGHYWTFGADSAVLQQAYTTARQARFEHGERPRWR